MGLVCGSKYNRFLSSQFVKGKVDRGWFVARKLKIEPVKACFDSTRKRIVKGLPCEPINLTML
jgi:hypothetical protein